MASSLARKPLRDVSNAENDGNAKPADKKRTLANPSLPAPKTRKVEVSTTSARPAPSSSSRSISSASSSSRSVSSSSSKPAPASASSRSGSSTLSTTLAGSQPNKRAAWDMKGRLQDLEELHALMKDRMKENNEKVSTLEKMLNEKELTVSALSHVKEEMKGSLVEVEKKAREEEMRKERLQMELERERERFQTEVRNLKMDISSLQNEISNLQFQIRQLEGEREKLRALTITQSAEMERAKREYAMKESQFQSRISDLESHLKEEVEGSRLKSEKMKDLERQIFEQREKIEEMEERQRSDENLRRKLHNAIQELKGNIRVYCRVRPLLREEQSDTLSLSFLRNDPRSLEYVIPAPPSATGRPVSEKERKQTFSFDKVFPPSACQDDVFVEICQLVQSSLDGYNTCIFAYGQTGSGKTYTMEGPQFPNEETEGMIPRAVKQIFQSAKDLEELGWMYNFEVLFLEIYNENVRDLLQNGKGEREEKSHEIKHSKDGETTVTDMTVIKVKSPEEVRHLLRRANKNRATAATEKNDRSSRSHSVFQIRMDGRNTISGKTAESVLSLVDLAGSERLSVSGAEGQRKKETQHINKSLSALGDVIAALANKEQHIPYRNSKLTYLLQNSLGGNSKALMFVNVSPSLNDAAETMSSLRFATKVNSCEIGVARRGGKVEL